MSAGTDKVIKRSLVIAGHATSISLEDEFWQMLKRSADARSLSVAGLVAEVDRAGRATNLSSALRVFCLREALQARAEAE
jgi:predicted DNA-binding ribbon-helix-helix protein